MTILYADDDSDDRIFLSEAIREIDPAIRCITVCDGMEALAYLESTPLLPDLVLLDINMPVMDGWECMNEIRKRKRCSEIPILIYSTTSDPVEILRYEKMGASFLCKPSSFRGLCEMLMKHLTFQQVYNAANRTAHQ